MEIDRTESSTELDVDELEEIFRELSFCTKTPSLPELNPDEVAMGRACQEDSGVCLAGPECVLQNSSYAQSSYQPDWGLFCYSQDPPPAFYNPVFEEYTPDKTCSFEKPDGVLNHGDISIPQVDTAVCGDYYRWEPGSQYLAYMGVINREVNPGDGTVNASTTIHASHDTPMMQPSIDGAGIAPVGYKTVKKCLFP